MRRATRVTMFPQSIEVQMMSGNAGDFWCIEENIEVPDMETRRPRKEGQKYGGSDGDARRILNLTDGSEKPLGEWNTMAIEARGRTVKVWVNGDLVNEGFNSTADRGKIAIQAEGAEVEFRRIEIVRCLRQPAGAPREAAVALSSAPVISSQRENPRLRARAHSQFTGTPDSPRRILHPSSGNRSTPTTRIRSPRDEIVPRRVEVEMVVLVKRIGIGRIRRLHASDEPWCDAIGVGDAVAWSSR